MCHSFLLVLFNDVLKLTPQLIQNKKYTFSSTEKQKHTKSQHPPPRYNGLERRNLEKQDEASEEKWIE